MVKRSSPVLPEAVRKEWFGAVDNGKDSVHTTQATDKAFNMLQNKAVIRTGWTEFNQSLSQNKQEVTTIGYLPILWALAHEFDTLNTIVKRCMHISVALGQQHTNLTELKWAIPGYQKKLVVQLGGFYISMCFQKVNGNNMKRSGFVKAWVESGLLKPNVTEHVVNGKAYQRAMHADKITLPSLWHLLMPYL